MTRWFGKRRIYTKEEEKMKKMKKSEPYMVISKKKHPFGKPIELYFFDLRMWVGVGYMTQFGKSKSGKLATGKSKVDDVTLFFDTKEEHAWMRFDVKEARKLKDALDEIFDEDKNGYVKRTHASHTITKYQRYKK